MENFEKLIQLLQSQEAKSIEVGLQIAQNDVGFINVKNHIETILDLPKMKHFRKQFFADDRRFIDLDLLLNSKSGKLSMVKVFEKVPGIVCCLPFQGNRLPIKYSVHFLEFDSHEFTNLEGLIEEAYFEVENLEEFYEIIKTDSAFDKQMEKEIYGYEEDQLKDFFHQMVQHYWGACTIEERQTNFIDAFCKKHQWQQKGETNNLTEAFQIMTDIEEPGNEIVSTTYDIVCDAFSDGFAFSKLLDLFPAHVLKKSKIVHCETIPMEAHHSDDSFTLLLAHYE